MFFLKKRGGAALPAKRGELSCGAWSLPLPATQPGYSWMSYWLPLLPEVGLLNRDWRGPAGTKCPFLPVVAPRWWGWENNFFHSCTALLLPSCCKKVLWRSHLSLRGPREFPGNHLPSLCRRFVGKKIPQRWESRSVWHPWVSLCQNVIGCHSLLSDMLEIKSETGTGVPPQTP